MSQIGPHSSGPTERKGHWPCTQGLKGTPPKGLIVDPAGSVDNCAPALHPEGPAFAIRRISSRFVTRCRGISPPFLVVFGSARQSGLEALYVGIHERER